MENKYTVKQLEALINLSHTAIRKKIADGEFKTTKEIVNKRKVTLVKFTEKDFRNLISAYGYREETRIDESNLKQVGKQPEAIEATIVKEGEEEVFQDSDTNKTSLNISDISELFDKFNKVHREYREELINTNKKLALLEDSERRKEQSYIELQAHNQQLKKQLEETSDRLKELETALEQKSQSLWTTPLSELAKKL